MKRTGSFLAAALLAALPAAAAPIGLIDAFDDADLSDYTLTKILDQGSADNVVFSSPAGLLEATSVGADGAEQVLLLNNTGVSLDVGEELQIDNAITAATGNDLGLAVGATPTAGVRENYLFISFRSATQLNTRGFLGASEIGQVQAFGVNADTLFIARTAADTFELGYYDGASRNIVRTETGADPSIGDNVGFYADLRADGASFSGLDNLRIVPEPTAALLAALTLAGAATRRS